MKNSNDIESVFDIRLKQERNGLVYLPNETTPFTGVFVGWYENGLDFLLNTKRAESHYIDGKENGLSTLWYGNGQKKSEGNYKDGKKVGQWFTNYPAEWEEEYSRLGYSIESNYKNGELDGKYTSWYDDNGQKKEEGNYKDGKKVGKWIAWHSNGQKECDEDFLQLCHLDGKRDGKCTSWYENGTKRAESHYIDGKENGLSTLWHSNGQKKSEGNYKDGKKVGQWTGRRVQYPFPRRYRYNDVERGYYIRGKRVKWYFVIFVVLIIYFLT